MNVAEAVGRTLAECGIDQAFEVTKQGRVVEIGAVSPATGSATACGGLVVGGVGGWGAEFAEPGGDGGAGQSGGLGDEGDAAAGQGEGFAGGPVPAEALRQQRT